MKISQKFLQNILSLILLLWTISTFAITSVDTTKPVITLLGDENITLTVGDTYTDAGATAMDDVDGDISANIQIVSDVNTSVEGNYTVTYLVSDSAENIANMVSRKVYVLMPIYTRDDTKEIVTNHITKLQWQDNKEAKIYTVSGYAASDYCIDLSLGGYSDWRLPTKNELMSIFNYSKNSPPFSYPEFKNTDYNELCGLPL